MMYKRKLSLLFIIILIISLTGCGKEKEEEKIEYEDVYALVEEYNAIFKETTYYDNYEVNEENGQIIKYESYNLNRYEKKINVHKFTTKYDDNDNKIKEIEEAGYVITRMYKYNNNELIEFSYKSSKDNIEELTKYENEYDDKNRLIKRIEREEKEDGDTIITTYKYYEDGKLKSKHYQNDDYYLNYEYTYNDDGKLATETQESKKSFYKIEYEYDENGNKTKEKVYEDGSALIAYTHTFKYEKVGKKIKN